MQTQYQRVLQLLQSITNDQSKAKLSTLLMGEPWCVVLSVILMLTRSNSAQPWDFVEVDCQCNEKACNANRAA